MANANNKKFWINVKSAKCPSKNDDTFVAVYGNIDDALDYAWDYMSLSFGIHEVTVCDENWNVVCRTEW